ncbi:MAG: LPD38 domain-containing protein [Ramlibacter sp.]
MAKDNTFSFEEAAAPAKGTFSFDDALGPKRDLPEGVKPSDAGGGRGRVNPAPVTPEVEPEIDAYDAATAMMSPAPKQPYSIDERRTRTPGRVTDKDIPARSLASAARDVVSGTLQIGPTIVKGAGDLARLATADTYGNSLSEFAERGNKSIQEVVGSERASLQRKRFEQDMQDPAINAGEVILGNPGALADQVLPTVGSMAIPVGVAAVAGKLATGTRAAQLAAAIDASTVAARANRARDGAAIGATVVQNAGDTFSTVRDADGDLPQSYLAAAITAPFTYVAGRLTGGGAEAQASKLLAGQRVAKAGAGAIVRGAGKEGGQEVGEEIGQYVGETTSEGKEFDANTASKRLAVAGTLGAVMGGGVDTAGHVAGILEDRARIKRLTDAGEKDAAAALQRKVDTASAASELQTLAEAAPEHGTHPAFQAAYTANRSRGVKPAEAAARAGMTAGFTELGVQAGLTPKAVQAALGAASKLPMADVPAFLERFTANLNAKGMGQGVRGVASTLDTVGHNAMTAAADSIYAERAAEVAETTDAITALEQQRASVEPVQPAAPFTFEENQADTLASMPPVDAGAHAAAISHLNDKREPTREQILAGNAALGHVRVGPLDVSVENPSGTVREDKHNVPPKWRTEMDGVHYGYIKRTQAADSSEAKRQGVDVFIQEGTPEDYAGPVFVVDQVDKGGAFDEHKALIGPQTADDAKAMYLGQYEKGWTGLGAITEFPSVVDFNRWVKDGRKTDPASTDLIAAPDQDAAPPAGGVSVEPARGAEPVAPADGQAGPAVGERYGRNGTPLSEGGKPFKSREVAQAALFDRRGKRLVRISDQRVVRVDGGFAHADRIPAQLAANAKAAQRLANPQTSARGQPMPAHAFIAAEGGLSRTEMSDSGFDKNERVGNRTLFARQGAGMTIEKATEKLIEAADQRGPDRTQPGAPAGAPGRDHRGDGLRAADDDAGRPGVRANPAGPATSWTLNPSGTLTVNGDPAALKKLLTDNGITRMMPGKAGVLVAVPQAAKAQKVLEKLRGKQPRAAKPKESKPLMLGSTPSSASLVTVKDGVIYVGKYEAIDFESGEPITVREGASDAEIKKALQDGGAIARRDHFFGGAVEAQESSSSPVAPQQAAVPEDNGLASPTERDVVDQQQRKDAAEKLDEKQQIDREATGQTLTQQTAPEQRKDTTGDLLGGPSPEEVLTAKRAKDAKKAKAVDDGGTVAMFKREGDASAIQSRMSISEVQAAVDKLTAKWKDGPQLRVVQTHLALPGRAAFDTKGLLHNGTAYVVARRHRTANDVGRTLAHEAIAHYGLRNMLGTANWIKLMNNVERALKSGNKPLTEVQAFVKRTYVNKDGKYLLSPGREADEVVARFAEASVDENGDLKPGYGFLKSMWAQIAQFLRDLGIDIKFTTAELHGMLVLAQKHLEVGHRTQGSGQMIVAAARADGFNEAVDRAIKEATEGKKHGTGHVEVGTPSPSLLRGGVPDLPLRTSAAILAKAHFEHGVPKSALKELPELLDTPFLVFDSDTVKGSFLVVTSKMIGDRPMVVAIKPSDARGDAFNFVPTLLPKNGLAVMQRWMDDGLLRYRDTKQNPQWFGSFRAPIARGSRPTGGSNEIVPPKAPDGEGGGDGLARRQSERPDDFDGGGIAARDQASLFEPDTWSAPEPTRTDRVIYELQDGRVDLKRVQEAIKKAGNTIEEKFDPRQAESLYPGRVARRTELFLENEVAPLLQQMARDKVSTDELADFLIARHAPERNEQVAKVNPELPDGGAGRNSAGTLMTTAAAEAYIEAIPDARRAQLESLAAKVDAITKGTRKVLFLEGLEKADALAAWEAAYANYVPLFKEESEHPHPQGMGFAVKGPASKRATGSTKQVTNVLAHVLMQREAAITRAEKNRVGLALYGLALSNPNPDFWTTIKPGMSNEQIGMELQRMGVDPTIAEAGMKGVPTITMVDPLTQRVVHRPNPIYKSLPGAITLKVNGEDRVLMINTGTERGLRMAEALKNLDGLTKLDLANSVVGKATRWMASVNTQYNPAFGLVNLSRDVLEGAINLGSTELRGSTLKVLALVPMALQGIAREQAGGTTSEWSKLFKQFQDDGGKTGYREMFAQAEDRAKAIEKDLAALEKAGKLTAGKVGHAVLDLLDAFNTTLENAVRLSAYKTALDQGLSRPKAALLARELTVDFNRKGRAGRELGPLYAFFNTAVQGAERALRTLKGPTGGRVLAGGLMLGVMQALMMAAAGYDDDEIPEYVKTRAFIIPLPAKDGQKRFIAIPMPLGFLWVPNTGRVATELVLNGGKDLGKRVFHAIGEITGSFSPFGGGDPFTADGALRLAAPTVVDPIVEIGFNRNFAGNSIERQPFKGESDNRPGFARAKESTLKSTTGQVYLGISKAINALTGGTAYEAGALSPTPERLHYLAQTIGGGVLRELEKTIDASVKAARGEKVKTSQIPILGRFAGEVDPDQVQASRYYDQGKKLDKIQTSLGAAKAAGDGEAMVKMLQEHPEAALIKMHDKVQRQLGALNKMAVTTIGDPAQSKVIDEARVAQMKTLNDAIVQLEEASGKVTLGQRLRGAAKKSDMAAAP